MKMKSSPFGSSSRFSRLLPLIPLFIVLLIPLLGYADVEGSLVNMKLQLTGVILPLISVIGLGLASVSFFTGNPQARQHIVYAILGCIFGFGAQAISDWIAGIVR